MRLFPYFFRFFHLLGCWAGQMKFDSVCFGGISPDLGGSRRLPVNGAHKAGPQA